MRHDVFISYADEDTLIVESLVASLETKGVYCWFAPKDNILGNPFEGGIVKAITQSSLFIIVLSRFSDASNYVKKEVALAFKRGIPIIALRTEDFNLSDEMELYLGNIHWFQAESPTPEVFSKFAGEVLERLRKQRIVEVEPRVPVRPLFGRDRDVQNILDKLEQSSLAVIGMQGIGKSKVISAVFERVAAKWPTGFKTVYWRCLKQDKPPSFSIFGRSIIQELKGDHVEFDSLPVFDQVEAVLQVLKETHALLVVDQFETVMDPETRTSKDPAFARFLWSLVHQDVGSARVLITSWEAPKDDHGLSFPHYSLGGIGVDPGMELFEALCADGVRREPGQILRRIVDQLGGHPYAIELVARNYSETEIRQMLLEESLWKREISEIADRMVSLVWERIGTDSRSVLAAACVFFKPASRNAIAHVAEIEDTFFVIRELRQRALVIEVAGDLYGVHTLVREFVNNQAAEEDRRQRHLRAAAFYQCGPFLSRGSRAALKDIMPMLDALEHLLAGNQAEESAKLLFENGLHEDLYWWGHYHLLAEICERLMGRTVSVEHRIALHVQLGKVYRNLGKLEEARRVYENGLPLLKESTCRESEIGLFISLGDIFYYLNDLDRASEYHIKAEELLSANPNARLQSENAGDLANVMFSRKDYAEAQRMYERAIAFSRNAGNRIHEGIWNGGLGNLYDQLFIISTDPIHREQAISCYMQAIAIAKETKDRRHESHWKGVLGNFLRQMGELEQAESHLVEALFISADIHYGRMIQTQMQWLGAVLEERMKQYVRKRNFKAGLQVVQVFREKVKEIVYPEVEEGFEQHIHKITLNVISFIIQEGFVAEAITMAEDLLESPQVKPETCNALGAIGIEWGRGKRIREALKVSVDAYTKSIILSPDSSLHGLYARKGDAYALLGMVEEAISDYSEVMRREPQNMIVALSLAEVLIWAGRYEDAMVSLEAIQLRLKTAAEKTIWAWLMCHALNLVNRDFHAHQEILEAAKNEDVTLNYSVRDIEPYLQQLDQMQFSEMQIKNAWKIQNLITNFADSAPEP